MTREQRSWPKRALEQNEYAAVLANVEDSTAHTQVLMVGILDAFLYKYLCGICCGHCRRACVTRR